jgi:tRNA-Thr(GGU) m(6)t(6)A37 methyltransferase TsaA
LTLRSRQNRASIPKKTVIQPIGVVHTDASKDEIREKKKGISSEVEVFPQFAAALDGIEGFSHVFVIAYLNQLRPEQIGHLKVRPKGLLRYGLSLDELPLVGVFALDSPSRPNPIGLALVPLIRRKGRRLVVSDLDYFDGTPVLDIKPYQSSYRVEKYRVPDWHERLLRKAGRV